MLPMDILLQFFGLTKEQLADLKRQQQGQQQRQQKRQQQRQQQRQQFQRELKNRLNKHLSLSLDEIKEDEQEYIENDIDDIDANFNLSKIDDINNKKEEFFNVSNIENIEKNDYNESFLDENNDFNDLIDKNEIEKINKKKKEIAEKLKTNLVNGENENFHHTNLQTNNKNEDSEKKIINNELEVKKNNSMINNTPKKSTKKVNKQSTKRTIIGNNTSDINSTFINNSILKKNKSVLVGVNKFDQSLSYQDFNKTNATSLSINSGLKKRMKKKYNIALKTNKQYNAWQSYLKKKRDIKNGKISKISINDQWIRR